MIRVTMGNNVDNITKNVPEDSTLREVLEENGINYSVGSVQLDGATLRPGEIDKTFAELGITTKCFLMVITKMDNAA